MGYRGKLVEQERARELRARGWALQDIADELGVSKASVSVWVRDVSFVPAPRRRAARVRGPSASTVAKQAQIDAMVEAGQERIGRLSDRDLLIAGTALYAGEGSKTDGAVLFANTDPSMVRLFLRWLRECFTVDESRLRVRVYLHEGLDLDAATGHWAEVTGIPTSQFGKPYRAAADPTRRRTKHEHGCVYVSYSCARTHRAVMGLVKALLSSGPDLPG
jgi:hypothetical protein